MTVALLQVWELTEIAADAESIASELVTNAWRHPPDTDSFEWELVRRAHGVRVPLADGPRSGR